MCKTKVLTVDSIQLSIASVNGRVTLHVAGTVPTSGWDGAELLDTNATEAPSDGSRHFDFVAVKPGGIVNEVISSISASRTIQAGAGKLCVVVHAATNEQGPECIEVQIGDSI